jgi:hypothetical protein
MNLLRLLTAGRSLIGINGETCRYKIIKGNLLPDFSNEKRNPNSLAFGKPTSIPPASLKGHQRIAGIQSAVVMEDSLIGGRKPLLQTSMTSVQAAKSIGHAGNPPFGDAFKESQSHSEPFLPALRISEGAIPPNAVQPLSKDSSKGTGPSTHSANKNRSLFRRLFTSSTKANRALVQDELALETIKVMRNDLCGADMELIPTRISRGPAMNERKTMVKAGGK